jgi:tripartite-type tricarboxylate transporter receptor subunit TctC
LGHVEKELTMPRVHPLLLKTAGLLLALTAAAAAQDYPTKPVRVIVPFPPGAINDTVGRMIATQLSERLGKQFVVDNRAGAGGVVGTELAANAPKDGYTLLIVSLVNTVNPWLYKLSYEPIKSFAPIAFLASTPNVIVVHPDLPAKTLGEFIAYAKANPGAVNMASSGNGSTTHIFGELFKMMAGVDLVHVAFRGGYVPDLLGGRVQVAFGSISSSVEYIRSGLLRALAVTSAARAGVLPDVAAMSEFLPGYEAMTWYGVGAPANTPGEVIGKLNTEINAIVVDPTVKGRLAAVGIDPTPMTSAEFGKSVAAETEKWGKVITTANIKVG